MNEFLTQNENYSILPFTMDHGVMERAAIGLLVLETDQTIEHEWRQIMNLPGVAYFESRLPSPSTVGLSSLAEMEAHIAPATRLIVPDVKLNVVAFGCTSGAIVIGEDRVFAQIRDVRPGVACTTPITAAMAGLHALQVRNTALVTPYVHSVNDGFKRYIEAAGIAVRRIVTFNHAIDNEVARIDRASLRTAILTACASSDIDAVFVACTSLRMATLIQEVEVEIGKPVVSSNSAMAWHALRLANVQDPLPHLGRLFEI
ncbi:maleate cis-trans isomerase family protein [Acidithiobacillus thiooxidans]|uniref:maleate cis-trans isomerase family protein n=1 Tax=Acidithiobacillus thiooxidans TaxID=930 RepID=UPI001C06D232|nr:aspartate/glutamate racemase family protein [Acidithiobacillus thiooxidans]